MPNFSLKFDDISMMNNPILQEVRDARELLPAAYDFDLHRKFAEAMAKQKHQPTVNRQTSQKKETFPAFQIASKR
jgi:hypothetical protein